MKPLDGDSNGPRTPERSAGAALGERYTQALEQLQTNIDLRVRREQAFSEQFGPEEDEQEATYRRALAAIDAQREQQLADITERLAAVRGAAEQQHQDACAQARSEHLGALRAIEATFGEEFAALDAKYHDSSWVTSSVLDDSAEDSPRRQFEKFASNIERTGEQQVAEWTELSNEYQALAAQRRWGELPSINESDFESPPKTTKGTQQAFTKTLESARSELAALRVLKIPRLFLGYRPLILFAVIACAAAVPIVMFVDPATFEFSAAWDTTTWIAAAAGAGCLISALLLFIVYLIGAMQQADLLQDAQHHVAVTAWLHERWRKIADQERQRRRAQFEAKQTDFEQQRRAALDRYERVHAEKRGEIDSRRTRELRAENERYAQVQQSLAQQHAQQMAALEADHASTTRQATSHFDSDRETVAAALADYQQHRRRNRAESWHQLKTEWEEASRNFESIIAAARTEDEERFRPWEELANGAWTPPTVIPPAIRIGRFAIDLAAWPDAVSQDMRLAPRTTHVELPAVLEFPRAPSLLLKTSGAAGRATAVRALQVAMLRMLTLIPPGKLRFTILDPVGLGESFAGFMHLTDYDELLVTKRIWTETGQIEERLADLTGHMENVLQKYLRNEFATIEEYNESAGEVAEPYHILVVTDFPAKFSEIAARRLTSIVHSGPRCGVYTLISVDTELDLPNAFQMSMLDEHLPTVTLRKGVFHATSSELAPWPLEIDAPPDPATFTAIVKRVGAASKDARRVEVAFERVAPPPDEVWTGSSQREIDVPLGRAGATKLQSVRLGRGTSQHMLVAGKTGSGKSTFLHALITNVALHYSPDEIRFYLIDFKKGVEFKHYAALSLPHADVIAIESDREFGVSALQRLDGVLHERGDLFRAHGVQDLGAFRDACPDQPMPRILLVVDEFQEFFVEDDKLSQTAALLLDRLVRQGRAFGIHVVLGSQTLGGAYSLARSTMGQVAVRVALQCSEADAHLILSEENTAARLLTRPGEAIYNDANGLLEGNHPFQVAWLPDSQRESYLQTMQRMARERGLEYDPPIVFEGHIPSDPSRNAHLNRMIDAAGDEAREPILVPKIWLGEAVEIKQPTSLPFTRQTGTNLLLVGSDSDAALGILGTAVATLAAQVRGPGSGTELSPIIVLDGSQPDSSDAAFWRSVAEIFSDCVRLVAPREAAGLVAELAAEQQRRSAAPDAQHPPMFLMVYHLSRVRDLRKVDDDFGLGSFGSSGEEKPAEPGKQFADLLSGGPESAMHSLIWCDSYNNVDRWFSRQSMRELEYRVAFQMNASDSSNLIDNPAASKLGVHRALLYREETGHSEKFRPYGPPSVDWLRSVHARLSAEVVDSAEGMDLFRIL